MFLLECGKMLSVVLMYRYSGTQITQINTWLTFSTDAPLTSLLLQGEDADVTPCSSPFFSLLFSVFQGYKNNLRWQHSYLFAVPLTVLSLNLGSDEHSLLQWPLVSACKIKKEETKKKPTLESSPYWWSRQLFSWSMMLTDLFLENFFLEVNVFGEMIRSHMQI